MAASGTPGMVLGRISGGYLWLSVVGERMERVRRSSGGRDGAVKLEKDFAAVLRARREAVRLDVKVDFGFGAGRERVGRALGFQGFGSVGDVGRRGCSSKLIASLCGEETVFSFRSQGGLRGEGDGVQASLTVSRVLLAASSDGMDAREMLETGLTEQPSFSLSGSRTSMSSDSSPFPASSAGSSSISSGERLLSDDGWSGSDRHS